MAIIKYPTGLYISELPAGPSVVGDVTFTLSQPPPLEVNAFPQLPSGVNVSLPADYTISVSKAAVGEFIFTSSSANRVELGSSALQFTIGEVIAELAQEQPPSIDLLPGTASSFQHNLNTLDLATLGLSADQQQLIQQQAYNQYVSTQNLLNQARQDYLTFQTQINADQKSFNEANKAIAAVTAINKTDAMAAILDQLNKQAAALSARIALNVTAANTASAQVNTYLNQLLGLVQVVQ